MAGTKNHDYHILPPDIWPLLAAEYQRKAGEHR